MDNWDDLQIGYSENFDSRYFFANYRNAEAASSEMDNKENEENTITLDQELISINPEVDPLHLELEQANRQLETVRLLPDPPQDEESLSDNASGGSAVNAVPNIVTPSRWLQTKGAIPKEQKINKVPESYNFNLKYKQNRENRIKNQIEKEQQLREFRSRPAPPTKNPREIRKVHMITVPSTPMVLKRSKETEIKRLEQMQELKRQQKTATVKLNSAEIIKPFNLHCERRLRERKKFDEAVEKSNTRKQKEVDLEEEMRKKMEEERIRELRKATVFKARPNPFKSN